MLNYLAFGAASILVAGLGAWFYYSVSYDCGTEVAPYTVVKQTSDYEIRRYPELLVAETPMSALGQTDAPFWVLANYIFGENTASEKIAMTAPVTMEPKAEEIAMTAPVLMGADGQGPMMMAFVMPSKYTMETLPKPKDARVTFRKTAPRTVAVRRYSWYPTPERFTENASMLSKALARDGVKATGLPLFAGYDAPFIMPFLIHNEVHIPISGS